MPSLTPAAGSTEEPICPTCGLALERVLSPPDRIDENQPPPEKPGEFFIQTCPRPDCPGALSAGPRRFFGNVAPP